MQTRSSLIMLIVHLPVLAALLTPVFPPIGTPDPCPTRAEVIEVGCDQPVMPAMPRCQSLVDAIGYDCPDSTESDETPGLPPCRASICIPLPCSARPCLPSCWGQP